MTDYPTDRADVLAIGAHPDDVELVIGGTLHKLADQGHRVVIADLTRGEMGTRGSTDIRQREAAAAADILGIHARINLAMPDGMLENTLENRVRIIALIRALRPVIVLGHYWDDRHPDHAAAGRMLHDSLYPCGFAKFPAEGVPYRPNSVLFYMSHYPFKPSLVMDTTDSFAVKKRAISCYASQLHDPDSLEPETGISQPEFIPKIEGRDRYFGSLIGATFGEPFFLPTPLPMDDPVAHFNRFPRI